MQNEQECNCHKLFDYVSDLLTETEKSDFKLHMNSCPKCREDYLILKNIMGAVSAIPEVEVPESLKNSVSEALKGAEMDIAAKNRFNIKQIVKFAAPVAACVAVTIGFFSGGVYDSFSLGNTEISSGTSQNTTVVSESKSYEEPVISEEKEPIQTSKPYKQTEKPTNSAETPILENPTEQNENIAIASHETEDISGQTPEVANGETEPSVYARRTVKFPSSCVIKTDNPDELISSIDIDITNEAYGFSIKAEDWELFENYIAESGAEYEVEYSEDIVYNIDIEIENSQTLEKEDIE